MATLTARIHEDDGSRLVGYDFGAHLAEWSVDGEPVVWLSERAVLDGTAPLRGGVPICFPWFAAGHSGGLSPSHGLVRTATWRPSAPVNDREVWAWEIGDEEVSGDPGAEHLPGPFSLRYAVSVHRDEVGLPRLRLALIVTNPSADVLRAEAALHTYLAVDDITRTRVDGLDGAAYLDKVLGVRGVQSGPVTFEGETDRIYDSTGSEGAVVVRDGRRELHLRSEGGTQTVVWNPWADKCARTKDLADDAWREFVCVESAATGHNALVVPPGASSTLTCTLTLRQPTAA